MICDMQPHIMLGSAQATPVALVVGDPGRAEAFAKLTTKCEELACNREYRSFRGEIGGQKVLIVSHGVGSAGAAICFTELCNIGVKCIIRAGTCGSLQPERIQQGDVVIAYAAAKEDGVTRLQEPVGMPAVATFEVTQALLDAAKRLDAKVTLGITVTSDLFYAPMVNEPTLRVWQKAQCATVEMEVSCLFTICRLRNVDCGAVLAVDGCPFGWKTGDYNPTGDKVTQAKANMGRITLAAIEQLSRNYSTRN